MPLLCPACGSSVSPGDRVCFHCRAVLDPFTSGARVADRYVIEASIGQGGMGRVYRAYDETLREKVAIKTLLQEYAANPQFLARFREEVRLARRVAHPNVCRVYDYVDHAGTPFLSMEWVEGETLAERRQRLGPRPEAELSVVVSDVTAALLALWSQGIVHRDLKPANLMWTLAGRVKVMDFGLARAFAATDRDQTSGVIGSAEYLSPEQIRGEKATEKSDTYALGVSLFELATGALPFRGATPAETLMKHLSEPSPTSGLGHLSEPLRILILGALEKNAARRVDLRKLSGKPAAETEPTSKPTSRLWWTAVTAILIAVLIYLGGSWSGSGGVETASPSPIATGTATPAPIPIPIPPSPSVDAARVPKPEPAERGVVVPSPPIARSASSPIPSPVDVTPALVATPRSPPPPSLPPVVTATPPPTIAPQEPAMARLLVVVTPWAEVFIDGDRKGLTPLQALTLPQGPHVVELRHPDYRPFRRTVNLKPGELLRMSADLRTEAVRR